MVKNFVDGGAAVNQLCRAVDADLRVYEMALDEPTADFTEAPAMSEEECAPGDRLRHDGGRARHRSPGARRDGHRQHDRGGGALLRRSSAAARRDWVGPGTGVAGAALAAQDRGGRQGRRLAIAARRSDAFDLLRRLGGRELAAIVGAIIAARLARVPVLLDGYATTAAAAVLFAVDPRALDHCLVAHRSAEPGHRRLLERLGKAPLLDLGMRLGEASGATLAIAIVKAALACHTGMATFAEAGVSGKEG